MTRRRLLACVALMLLAGAVAGAVAIAVAAFPRGLIALALLGVALPLGWYAALRGGARRAAGLIVAGTLGCLESPMLVEEWLVRGGGGEGAGPTAPPPAGGVR